MKPHGWLVRVLWTAVFVLAAIGVSAAVTRTLIITGSFRVEAITKQFVDETGKIRGTDPRFIEERYGQHPRLMLLHVIPGMFFMILGPLQFVPRLRSGHIGLHRWSGRAFLVSGVLIGISALAMPFRFPLISGPIETAATSLFGSWFLVALGKAFLHVRRRQIPEHRKWMIRAFAIGLAIATDRPANFFFFAFTQMPVREYFGLALWLCFCSHAVAAEAWIYYTRRAITKVPLQATAQLT